VAAARSVAHLIGRATAAPAEPSVPGNDTRIGSIAAAVEHTHTHTQPLSGTTRVGRYHKKHSPIHTQPFFVNFLHLLRPTASSVSNLRTWQSFFTTSLQVFCFLLVCDSLLDIHTFLRPIISSSVRNTCPYRRSLFSCI